MRGMKWLVAAMAIALLGGCATTGGTANVASHPVSQSAFDADVDYQMMAIITEDALRRGYKIVGVHPPQKKRAASND